MANGTNGNGETRKTVAQLAKEVVQQKTSIEVLRNEVKSVASVNEKLDNTSAQIRKSLRKNKIKYKNLRTVDNRISFNIRWIL